jgi:hypothetical protein
MNKTTFLFFCAITLGIVSNACKNSKEESKATTSAEEAQPTIVEQVYTHIMNKDSIVLVLKNVDGKIEGKLDISYYEKDSRRGTLSNGILQGDTLYANYLSMQEGEQSDCEIAFLKKGDTYIMTNDFIGEDNYQYSKDYTKGSFKHKNKIKFDGDTLKMIVKK